MSNPILHTRLDIGSFLGYELTQGHLLDSRHGIGTAGWARQQNTDNLPAAVAMVRIQLDLSSPDIMKPSTSTARDHVLRYRFGGLQILADPFVRPFTGWCGHAAESQCVPRCVSDIS